MIGKKKKYFVCRHPEHPTLVEIFSEGMYKEMLAKDPRYELVATAESRTEAKEKLARCCEQTEHYDERFGDELADNLRKEF